MITGLFLLASCETDNDSNPVLQEPTQFVLNTPALASQTYDLEYTDVLTLTCTQPDYGYTAATTYNVQISLTEDFASYAQLASSYTSARMDVAASEIAPELTSMLQEAGHKEDEFPMTTPVYVRLKASVATGLGEIYSNVIKLTMRTVYALPPVTVPEKMYVIGNFNEWKWDTAPEMVPVNGAVNKFWHLVYLDGAGVKFNSATSWNGNQVGYGEFKTITDNAGANLADNGGNLASGNPGWYLVIVTTSVEEGSVVYDLNVEEPNVYLMGTVTPGGAFAELEAGTKFSVPTTVNGEFVSPPFAHNSSGDGGVRAYVKIDGYDWWKTEFIVGLDGDKISYRGNGGDQERVQGTAGQQMYLNFLNDTGRIE